MFHNMRFLFWKIAEFALGNFKVSQLLGNLNVVSFLQGGNSLGTHSPRERFKTFRILVTADLNIYVHTVMTLIVCLHGCFQRCQPRWKYLPSHAGVDLAWNLTVAGGASARYTWVWERSTRKIFWGPRPLHLRKHHIWRSVLKKMEYQNSAWMPKSCRK